jgi:iron complex transport system substrate-binding protein
VSLNVCTDQLALEIAAPGQLLSLSNLSDDRTLSWHFREAAAYPKNRGLAEEVFLSHPDVVVTGEFSLHNTSALLQRLGFSVEAFPYNTELSGIPADIRRMGKALARNVEAEKLAGDFASDLAALTVRSCGETPAAIIYEQNGIAPGSGTLADSVLRAAGFRNLAAEQGIVGLAPVSLERLVQARPDVILVSVDEGSLPSLADQVPQHPALAALGSTARHAVIPAASLSCGGPFTLEALRALRKLHAEITGCGDAP